VNDRIRSGSPAQQVFLIFTVVPQFFGSQNAKKRKTAEKLPTATASRPDAMGSVRWAATEAFLRTADFPIAGFPKVQKSHHCSGPTRSEDATCVFVREVFRVAHRGLAPR
jgi:hypothetical protein